MTDCTPKLILFDLDKTLAHRNVSFEFGRFLYRTGRLRFFPMLCIVFVYFLHKIGCSSLSTLHNTAFQILFKGKSEQHMHALIALFLENSGHKLFRKELVKLIVEAQVTNCPVWIMSSSASCIVEPIAERLGVSLVTASYYALDASGCYCRVERVVDGDQKKQELIAYLQQTGLSPASVTAYSDSILDLALLKAVGRPVAVCPDRKLKRIAHRRSWQVLEV